MPKINSNQSLPSCLEQLAAINWQTKLASPDSAPFAWGIATGKNADDILSRASHALQVHGRTVIPATEARSPEKRETGARGENGATEWQRPEADGVYSIRPGEVVAVKTADCLPILFSATGPLPFAMAIHAGWRGFCAGIIEEGLDQAGRNGISPTDLTVIIGPAISAHRFEIGPEVLDALIAHSGPAMAAQFTQKGVADRWHADLQTAAAIDLIKHGIKPQNITVVRVCTFESGLPSYRREGKGCGRLVSWVETRLNSAAT
jgi:YfiH family protein